MKSIESILKEQENNSVLERRKHRSKYHNEMRSQSLAREASVEQPKKSGDVSTTLIEPASQMIAATGNSKMLVFNEQKLQEAYRKIDAYKLAQRIR